MRTPCWDRRVFENVPTRAQKCRLYQFCDPFDNYNTLSSLWEYTAGSPVISSAYRRFAPPSGLPGQGLYLPAGASAKKNMISNQATFIAKVAYYPLAYAAGTGSSILSFADANGGGYNQVAVVLNSGGALNVYRAWASPYTSAILASSAPAIIAPNHWYGIEIEFTINGSTGSVLAWVNGTQVLNATVLNTQFTANAYGNVLWLTDSANPGAYFDDLRVWDNTGSTQNAPLGSGFDSRLFAKLSSGPGALAQFTPNGAAANWQCTDDNPPDGDTTYVSGATPGLVDAYGMPLAGFSAPPAMVVARSMARKDDGAVRSLEIGVESSGSYGYGPSQPVGSTYAFYDSCIPLDPNTAAPPTAAAADAFQHAKQETA
jgi:hypothetical protein